MPAPSGSAAAASGLTSRLRERGSYCLRRRPRGPLGTRRTEAVAGRIDVASARAAYAARRGGDYGVTITGSISVNMQKVKERKDAHSPY